MSGGAAGGSVKDHVLRNQRCGKMWIGEGSGPRLWAVITIKMSFGPRFAYSTVTSKYRSPSNAPSSSSSTSRSCVPRPRAVAMSCSYG